jgi:hypothetical protein
MLLRALELEKTKVEARDGYYVATIDEIGLSCPGTTEDDALNSLRKSAFSLLRSLAEKGLLSERMKDRGIRMVFVDLPEIIKGHHEIIPVYEGL